VFSAIIHKPCQGASFVLCNIVQICVLPGVQNTWERMASILYLFDQPAESVLARGGGGRCILCNIREIRALPGVQNRIR
jgi:hypothetical protein